MAAAALVLQSRDAIRLIAAPPGWLWIGWMASAARSHNRTINLKAIGILEAAYD